MPAGGGSKRTDITVSYRGETNNLHLFWDINVAEMAEGNPEELAKKLADSITRKQRAEWQSGEPKLWTDESFRLSRSNAYTVGESMELSDGYVASALRIVTRRLSQAGVRLGWLQKLSLERDGYEADRLTITPIGWAERIDQVIRFWIRI